ncbi:MULTISPECIES: YdhR family protein [unclassified Mesorhizobium]|uniref:YdhR family protein n=1 Tax=unclassified Mesorhizobium TaxID=325217 RepID=UPI003336D4AC
MDRGARSRCCGRVYLFDSVEHAQAYIEKHSAHLNCFGIADIGVRSYAVNERLSMATRGR